MPLLAAESYAEHSIKHMGGGSASVQWNKKQPVRLLEKNGWFSKTSHTADTWPCSKLHCNITDKTGKSETRLSCYKPASWILQPRNAVSLSVLLERHRTYIKKYKPYVPYSITSASPNNRQSQEQDTGQFLQHSTSPQRRKRG